MGRIKPAPFQKIVFLCNYYWFLNILRVFGAEPDDVVLGVDAFLVFGVVATGLGVDDFGAAVVVTAGLGVDALVATVFVAPGLARA